MTLGGQREVRGRPGEGRGGHPEAEKNKKHFVKFKIMKLFGGFSLLLLNEFFDDLFLESPYFLGFFGSYIYENFGIFFR